ncbi:toxin-antitoxin system, toxin component, RelE family [Candidatus Vecturithrix granuli]|uniref:Toxin-antitoxin system, toxin component, RelE family n=1 Tax=Vecturithrix granuli TaxID=1499967 RepID=A0A081C8B9_VECG1|nr:toxin-antitoxin system, toxin component, RelE family [Candidatus Vecturithrix granuli]
MHYEIVLGPSFKRSVKVLKKRFPSVTRDVELAIEVLLENPHLGAVIPGSSGVRKIRIKNSDLTRGKSGGYRMLYYIEDQERQCLYLLLLYAKADRENITLREIQQLLQEFQE